MDEIQTDSGPGLVHDYDERGIPTGKYLAWYEPASRLDVEQVLSEPIDDDGRSEFLWIRFANGDLMLGVFPRGDTYCRFEERAGSTSAQARLLEEALPSP